MKRRRVLATLAASGVAATAGCSSVLSESGGGPYDAGGHVQWLGASDGAVFALSEGDPNTLHGVDGSWTADVAGVATPLVDDGVVAVPTGADDRGIVYCPEKIALFDAESGTRQWRVSAPHCPELVTVGPDAVFTAETSDAISESGRRLAALDRADGATRWERDVGTVNDAVRTDDALLVAHRGGLDKLDPASGDVLWSIPELTRPRSLSVSGDEVVAVGDTVSRIDGGTGEVTTSFSPSGSQVADAAVDLSGDVAYVVDWNEALWRVDLSTGEAVVDPFTGRATRLSMDEHRVYVETTSAVHALPRGSGDSWQFTPDGDGESSPTSVVAGDSLFVVAVLPDGGGGIFALDPATGERHWERHVGESLTAIGVGEDALYAGLHDGRVFELTKSDPLPEDSDAPATPT